VFLHLKPLNALEHVALD
ncbi:hypothetical protein VCHENC02_2527B, partial [Vibrio harveyi]